jgi:hypothetical protein
MKLCTFQEGIEARTVGPQTATASSQSLLGPREHVGPAHPVLVARRRKLYRKRPFLQEDYIHVPHINTLSLELVQDCTGVIAKNSHLAIRIEFESGAEFVIDRADMEMVEVIEIDITHFNLSKGFMIV